MKHLTFAVIVVMILTCCAAMAQTDRPWIPSSGPINFTNIHNDETAPAWAQPTWNKGTDQGNLNGYPDGTLRPNANPTRAEAWAMAVAAAKQIWRDNSWWLTAVLIGLTFGLVAGLIALVLMRRELNALRNQPSAIPAINLTLSLPNGLWNGPLVSGVSATASPTVSAEGGSASAAAEGGTGGTANQADNASNAGTRTTTTETTNNDNSVKNDASCATGAFNTEMPFVAGGFDPLGDALGEPYGSPSEDKVLYYYRPIGVEFSEFVCRVLDPDGKPDESRPEGWVLTLVRLETRFVNMYPMEVPVAYYGKPATDTPADSDRLEEEVNDEPGTTSGGIPV